MSALTDRAKLRASQQRKLDHACDVIEDLIRTHMPDEIGDRETAELAMMKARLTLLIKHQHVIDREVVARRMEIEGY